MPSISVLIKPASGNCNLNCSYCFYTDEMKQREIASRGYMDENTIERIIQKILAFATGECNFAFQGGEPTLVGLNFYKKVVQLQEQYNINKVQIYNSIQTNGCLLNEEWVMFLQTYQFIVGISLDGIKKIHDRERLDKKGNKTFVQVMHGIDLLKKYKVSIHILTVVTAQVAEHIEEIFSFYQKRKLNHLQFIPCLDPLFEERGAKSYSLTPKMYGTFLKRLFDLWFDTIYGNEFVYVRFFDNLLQKLKGYVPEHCGSLGHCTCQFVIEADGSVYPCDFYAIDSYFLGNMKEKTISELYQTCCKTNFLEESKICALDCNDCKWYSLCRGGCRRDREPMINGRMSKNYYCEAYQEFFEYAMDRLMYIVSQI